MKIAFDLPHGNRVKVTLRSPVTELDWYKIVEMLGQAGALAFTASVPAKQPGEKPVAQRIKHWPTPDDNKNTQTVSMSMGLEDGPTFRARVGDSVQVFKYLRAMGPHVIHAQSMDGMDGSMTGVSMVKLSNVLEEDQKAVQAVMARDPQSKMSLNFNPTGEDDEEPDQASEQETPPA